MQSVMLATTGNEHHYGMQKAETAANQQAGEQYPGAVEEPAKIAPDGLAESIAYALDGSGPGLTGDTPNVSGHKTITEGITGAGLDEEEDALRGQSSKTDNDEVMLIVGWDSEKHYIKQVPKSGARYLWSITLDAQHKTLTFYGQNRNSVSATLAELTDPVEDPSITTMDQSSFPLPFSVD